MKIKRIKISTIIIFFMCTTVTVFSLAIVSYYNNLKFMMLESEVFYSRDVKSFIMESENYEKTIDYKWTNELSNSDYILYKKNIVSNQQVSAVYTKGQTYMPPILKGNYFTESDMNDKKGVAIVGKEILKSLYNKEKYTFMDDELDIIGILGYENKSSIYDNMILINLPYVINKTGIDGMYLIDGIDNSTNIKSLIDEKLEECSIYEQDNNELSNKIYVNDNSGYKQIFICLIVIMILTSFSVSLIWISDKKDSIAVKKLIGVKDIRIISDTLIEYVKYSSISAIIGIVIIMILNCLTSINININLEIVVKSYLLTFIITIIIAIPSLLKSLKGNISTLMR